MKDTTKIKIKIKKVRPKQDHDLPFPRYMSPGASGMDLYAAIVGEITIKPGEVQLIPTGIAVAIPEGYEFQIRPRSGLATRFGLGLINSPGTIDSDYRGEILVPVINFSKEERTIKRGDRIAQMVLQKVYKVCFEIVEELDHTTRGAGGFGHTGI